MPAPDEPLSKEEARALFHEAMNTGSYILSEHARKRMRERGIVSNDLLALGRTGSVLQYPERHSVTGDWTYCIESKTPEIKAVNVIANLERVRIRLVTVIATD